MQVTIESLVGGNLAGYLQCSLSGHESLGSLISSYCESKGIPVNPDLVLKDKKGMILDSRHRVSDCNISHGDTLYLEGRGSQSGIFRFMNWWLLAVGAILMALGGLITVLTLHFVKGPTPSGYGVVLDGGSSHTGLFVYRWDGPKWMGTGVLEQIGSCRINGDIASLYNNISGIDPFLSPCLSYATETVPAASRTSTPIFFGATAGFRLLNMTDPSGTQVLLDGIRNRLSRSGFQFDPSYVEILSGMEEAEFSWITVNTQLHHLGPNATEELPLVRSPPGTVGALDLGGASTQLSMENPAGGKSEEGHNTLELYGRNYSVYSQSSLCYGVNEVVKRYQSILVANRTSSADPSVTSPCHPVGFNGSVRSDQIFSTPCAQNRSAGWIADRWTANGTSDYPACSALMDGLFNTSRCLADFAPSTCFSKAGLPAVSHRDFLAFSSLNVITKELNMTDGSSLEDLRKAVRTVCAMTWSEISQLPLANPSYGSLLCLESQYVLSLLTSGYGFDDQSWAGLHFVKQIAGADVGWTLGYMTERTNRMASMESKALLGLSAFITLAVLFALFLAVGLLLAYHAGRMKGSSSVTYSRILLHRMDEELERFLPAAPNGR